MKPYSMNNKFYLRFCSVLAASLACSAVAQNYSIDWYSIGGGGGTSTGSVYSVSGTIGRPAVGRSSGGNYSLESGFWSIVTVLQTPGGPLLTLVRSGANVVLSWPDDGSGFHLEQTTTVAEPGSWAVPLQMTMSTNAGVISATTPGAVGYQFFRLKK
jgi:hypothetical protein